MNHRLKPIVEPDGSQSLYWLLFPEGSIATPIAVLTDYEMEQFVKQYNNLHKEMNAK